MSPDRAEESARSLVCPPTPLVTKERIPTICAHVILYDEGTGMPSRHPLSDHTGASPVGREEIW